ncbi:MAG TPA: hypothetical protein VLA74_03640 [Nitrososphaeraceae archaeon]|nr:hypothetical protein [Nitrososphaeraceae archaeon]
MSKEDINIEELANSIAKRVLANLGEKDLAKSDDLKVNASELRMAISARRPYDCKGSAFTCGTHSCSGASVSCNDNFGCTVQF